MKEILKNTLAIFTMIILLSPIAKAESNDAYYTNNMGVEMTQEEYNYLSESLNEKIIKYMTKETFEDVIDDINSLQLEKTDAIYVKTTTFEDPSGTTFTTEDIITESEYNNLTQVQSRTACNSGNACWETNAKKLTIQVYHNTTRNTYYVYLNNLWKTIPNVKSFDVAAFRWTSTSGEFNILTYAGTQYYNNSSSPYSYGGKNSKLTSSGLGISMNILDETTTYLENEIVVYGYFTQKTAFTIYGTYQHATSATNLEESQSYTFSSSGLGGVLYYSNSTIRNKYDGMTGISYTFSPALTDGPIQIV